MTRRRAWKTTTQKPGFSLVTTRATCRGSTCRSGCSATTAPVFLPRVTAAWCSRADAQAWRVTAIVTQPWRYVRSPQPSAPVTRDTEVST